MGRKVRITREMILQAAYEILDEAGIGAVGIKAIASRLGCSTQPVSWVFGSMKELKKELFRYANARAFAGLPEQMTGRNAIDAFFASGVYYLSIACEHPNVFRFITVDDPMGSRCGTTKASFRLNSTPTRQICLPGNMTSRPRRSAIP